MCVSLTLKIFSPLDHELCIETFLISKALSFLASCSEAQSDFICGVRMELSDIWINKALMLGPPGLVGLLLTPGYQIIEGQAACL